MIKLPKEVNNIIKALEKKGFSAYAVGGCVRDSLTGQQPIDWDLATNAESKDMKAIFPEAKVISEKYSVIRIDHTKDDNDDGIIADVATFRKEGPYSDKRRPDSVEFVQSIEEDLKRRDFTVNAIADNPSGKIVDPFEGRKDIENRLIRTVGDPIERFSEDPLRMIRAVRVAAELDFDIHKKTYEAIVANAGLLSKANIKKIREEFERIITAPNAGKGLRMLAGADLMPAIIGDVAAKLNRRQMQQFSTLCDNIDKTKPVLKRRLGLFYTCFEEKKGMQAIEILDYDEKTKESLKDALLMMEKLHFLRTGVDLKAFLVKYGPERYEYLDNLSKAQRIVYDLGDAKIISRHELLKMIKDNNEPIYIEDLAIKGDDIIKAGIAEGEQVGHLLLMLTDIVHKKPKDNNKKTLLKYARRFSKNKLAARTRKVKWLR
ncbi:MAG: hypothetical protein GX578_01835 [Clostridiales bacterium]|nr:hypothetical protein [Clostridiales bacterium]